MIEDVEDFGAQLQAQFFRDVSVFEDREVDVVITGTTQRVTAERAKVPGAGNARSSTAVAGRIKCARHFECREVDETIRRACAGVRIADEIGSREKLAGVVVVIEQRQMKRIPAPHRHNRIQLPALAETGMGFGEVWNTVADRSDEAMAAIKV